MHCVTSFVVSLNVAPWSLYLFSLYTFLSPSPLSTTIPRLCISCCPKSISNTESVLEKDCLDVILLGKSYFSILSQYFLSSGLLRLAYSEKIFFFGISFICLTKIYWPCTVCKAHKNLGCISEQNKKQK